MKGVQKEDFAKLEKEMKDFSIGNRIDNLNIT